MKTSYQKNNLTLLLCLKLQVSQVLTGDSPGALQSGPPGLPGRSLVQVGDVEAAQLHGRTGYQGLDEQFFS